MQSDDPVRFDAFMAFHSGIGSHIRGLAAALDHLQDCPPVVVHTPSGFPHLDRLQTAPAFPGSLYGLRRRLYLPTPGPTRLFHFPHWNVPLIPSGRTRQVVTVHDLNHLRVPEVGGNALRRMYIRNWIKSAVSSADAVVTGSDHARLDIAGEFGLNPERITVIGNGLPDTWKPVPLDQVPLTLRRLHLDRPYLLAVGNGKPHKNLPWLVRHASDWLDQQGLNHQIVLTGSAPGVQDLSPRTRIVGHLSTDDLRAVYQGATALVMPSLYEGFGLPVIEAQALGTPVACSNAASLPEVSGGEMCAALFDPRSPEELGKALTRIMDPLQRSELIRLGAQNAAQYTWDRVADRLLSVWKPLLNSA